MYSTLIFVVIVLLGSLSRYSSGRNANLVNVDEENWRQILTGEWMIQFHAPWCPACRDLKKSWDSFAGLSKELHINVAEVDITLSPGLSGRFLVTALPTLFHVKDSVFRQYVGSKDKEEFTKFIEDKKWSLVPPVPSWKHPDTIQMTVVSYFFKVSMAVRDLHNYLVEKQGIPSWGSYLIFALAILVIGCVLGFVIVYLIDVFFPTTFTDIATEVSTRHKDLKKKLQKSKGKDKKSGSESSDIEPNNSKVFPGEGELLGKEEGSRQRKKQVNGKG